MRATALGVKRVGGDGCEGEGGGLGRDTEVWGIFDIRSGYMHIFFINTHFVVYLCFMHFSVCCIQYLTVFF